MSKKFESPYMEKEKDPRFSDEEIVLLKRLNEANLKLFRKVFYQDVLTEQEVTSLQAVLSTDLLTVLKRFFIQDLDHNEPLFSMPNRWSNPRFDGMLTAEVLPTIVGRQRAIKFIKTGFERLNNIIADNPETLEITVDIRMIRERDISDNLIEAKADAIAMQDSIAFLESAILAIYAYVIKDTAEMEKIISRLKKDSAK